MNRPAGTPVPAGFSMPSGTQRETRGIPAIRARPSGAKSRHWVEKPQFSAIFERKPQKTYVKKVSFF
ncbi:MAG TPA: hypothetical protein VEA60_07230 [Allosphingosinicella sp.]|nr:hypothetical protein [Allosphingosinicella sp.]